MIFLAVGQWVMNIPNRDPASLFWSKIPMTMYASCPSMSRGAEGVEGGTLLARCPSMTGLSLDTWNVGAW